MERSSKLVESSEGGQRVEGLEEEEEEEVVVRLFYCVGRVEAWKTLLDKNSLDEGNCIIISAGCLGACGFFRKFHTMMMSR